jgi:hypothetical protein
MVPASVSASCACPSFAFFASVTIWRARTSASISDFTLPSIYDILEIYLLKGLAVIDYIIIKNDAE